MKKKWKFAFSIEVKDIPKKLSVEYMKFKYSLQKNSLYTDARI